MKESNFLTMKINRTVYPFHKQIQTPNICYICLRAFHLFLYVHSLSIRCSYTNEKIIKCDNGNAIVQHSVYVLFDI